MPNHPAIRLLVLSPIPEEGAGCRFRIAQFIPYLESAGFEVTLSSLFTTDFFRLVYRRGHYLRKAVTFTMLALKRLESLRRVSQFDAVFIYREVFPIGPALVERLLTMPGCPPVVFDFDDAIFLPNVSAANRFIGALKQPEKVATIIRRSRHVIAGNEYLADYARRFNQSVTTIPTSVDTRLFVPRPFVPPPLAPAQRAGGGGSDAATGGRVIDAPPIVGWIGSPTTASYIGSLGPILRRVHERHPFTLRLSGAGDHLTTADLNGVPTEQVPWSLSREVELFQGCDVGVYPLADDEWSKGKCGFKAIEFMACGVPVVAAAVGANRDIIEDGVNGFLASSEQEWIEKLGRLLSDPDLRRRFGQAGRKTVEERYSLDKNAPVLAETLRHVAHGGRSQNRMSA